MADARDEIAERQPPVAHAREPGVRLVHVLFGDPQIPAVAVDQLQAEGAAQGIAEGDAAGAAGERVSERQRQGKMALVHQVAGEGQQRLIGHRQPDDAAHQQEKMAR